jgi:hypothetical protein
MAVKAGGMMKTRFLLAAVLLFAAASVLSAQQKQVRVTVKETPMRATPSALGKILTLLNYDDLVTILDQPAGAPKNWVKIRGPDGTLQGWVSASALPTKKIELAAGSQNVQQGASNAEVSLAGKGIFDENTERQYQQENKADFDDVERMVQIKVSDEQVSAFIEAGGLSSPDGGAQ